MSVGKVDTSRPTATSDLCTNASQARISDVIWHENDRQGIALTPKQHVLLDPWISFPQAPNLIPFEVQTHAGLQLDEQQLLYALLETQIFPVEPRSSNVLMVDTLFNCNCCVVLILNGTRFYCIPDWRVWNSGRMEGWQSNLNFTENGRASICIVDSTIVHVAQSNDQRQFAIGSNWMYLFVVLFSSHISH